MMTHVNKCDKLFFIFLDCNLTESTFELSDTNELTVNWIIDSTIPYCTFNHVKIELTLKDCDTDCTTTVDRIPISNFTYKFAKALEACGSYEYRIIENQYGNQSARIMNQFRSHHIHQIIEFQVKELEDQTNLRVFWSYTQYPLCPKKFRVEVYQMNSKIRSLYSEKTSETIDDLEPCEEYIISVNPMIVDEVFFIYGSNKTYSMSPVIPTGIRNLTLKYNENESLIDINWLAPKLGSKCVESYEARVESIQYNRTKSDKDTKTNFQNIFACGEYKFEITANTINSMKSASVVESMKIPPRGMI